MMITIIETFYAKIRKLCIVIFLIAYRQILIEKRQKVYINAVFTFLLKYFLRMIRYQT